ncbi:MAG: flagellar filament capping protein FliD [Synergistaceae bacterium]|nr:flagellar filament capping protein FliD [Synergistaceae bacterium]
MASMSISGVVSGMDWESMIDEIITAAAKPAQVQVSKRTNLQNKKSLFEEMKVMMQSIQTSMTSLKLPSTYKAKAVDIERVDNSGSYKGVLNATVNADAAVNVYDITVQQLAAAQTNRSKQITGSTIASTLLNGGVSGKESKMYITAGGQKIGIDVYSTDSLQSLKSRINTTIKTLDNPLDLTASVVDNRLIIKSDNTGLGTKTVEGTVRGGYNSNGLSSLKGLITNADSDATIDIAVSDDDLDRLTVRSGSTTYTRGEDYDVVNGTEIRWRQYDESTHVAIGDSVNVKYTMAAGDVYTATGTYGSSEAEITGFTMKDNGTLADRLSITDAYGKTYTYGEDFTITDGKVEWLKTETVSGIPKTYTVSLKKTETTEAEITGARSSTSSVDDAISSEDFAEIEAVYKEKYSASIPTLTIADSNGVLRTYLDPKDSSLFTMKSGDEEYEYGRDYVIRVNDKGDGYVFSWLVTGDKGTDGVDIKDANIEVSTYTAKKGISTLGWKEAPSAGDYTFTFTDESTTTYSKELKSSSASNNLGTELGVTLTSDDIDNIEITSGSITYTRGTEGTDYTVDSEGNITWADDTEADYAIDSSGNITWRYTEIAKPAEDATYTVSYSGTATYYSQDIDIKATTDAARAVRITLDDGDLMSYAEASAAASPEDAFTIKDSEGNTYTYGTDFTFAQSTETNTAGENIMSVVWDSGVTLPDEGSYKVYYTGTRSGTSGQITLSSTLANPVVYDSEAVTYSSDSTASQAAKITIADDDLMSYDEAYAIATADSSAFYITDSKGTRYTYGTHFSFAQSTTEKNTANEAIMEVIWLDDELHPSEGASYTVHYSDDSVSKNLTLNSDFSVYSLSKTSALPDDASITITDSSGKSYTYGDEFTLESDGSIHWYADDSLEHPSGSYTLTYEAYTALEADSSALSIDSGDSTKINISDFSGVKLTYANLLSDLKLTKGSKEEDDDFDDRVQEAFADVFTLSDGTTTYEYGTDYEIIGSTVDANDKDAVSMPVINWLGTTPPTDLSSFTLTYTGRGKDGGEIVSTTVTRSAVDAVVGRTDSEGNSTSPTYSLLSSGTTTITQGAKTFYEHIDFTIEEGSNGMANISWIPDSEGGYEWYYPASGTSYTVNHTDKDGNETTFSGYRSNMSSLRMSDLGMTTGNGSLSVQYGDGISYSLDADYSDFNEEDEDGNTITYTANDAIRKAYAFTVDKTSLYSESGNVDGYYFNWYSGTKTTRSNMPSYGDEISVEYEYDANSFSLSDNGDGLLDALGLTDEENITEAHNAIILLDGNEIQRDSNDIGEAYGNEISTLKGVTLNLKGLGEVSLDVYHDAEKAIEAITTFKDSYNDLMTWMNTRMTESQVDKDTAATIDSDDFRMRWGLLHGNAILRQSKSSMRSLTAQSFNYSFTQRDSNEEVYGTMANNGLRNNATLRLRVSGVYSDITILPTDTLQDIVDRINDSTNPEMRNMYYGTDGRLLDQGRVRASISDDKLVISSTDNNAITMSGTSAMNALKMNYTYTGLFQLGLATTSTDYGKSGELDFDESKFMEALEENADETQELMLMYANEMDSWLKSMLNSSASGATKGTLSRQIDDIQTQIDSIDEYLEKYQDRLDRQEESLRTRFAAAEQSISKLSQQASSIAAILNQLNGYNSSSNSSSSSS